MVEDRIGEAVELCQQEAVMKDLAVTEPIEGELITPDEWEAMESEKDLKAKDQEADRLRQLLGGQSAAMNAQQMAARQREAYLRGSSGGGLGGLFGSLF